MTSLNVALVNWAPGDGIAQAIQHDLLVLGCTVTPFLYNAPIPKDINIVFSFAPYGEFLHLASRIGEYSLEERPILIHWDTEGIPDPRIPWTLAGPLCNLRSWIGRRDRFSLINKFAHRFRYVGDNLYAYRKGWLDIFANFSEVYASYYRAAGLPTVTVPWGTSDLWYRDLRLNRDIDVLWMGKRRTKRRSILLESIRSELELRGLKMYIVDGIENPFIFGEARTELLNRAKITLNLRWHRHDNVFSSRFHIAAGNKSLVISEPFQPHFHLYKEGVNFVTAPLEGLVDQIFYYLSRTGERDFITENAYQLVTSQMTLRNSLAAIMKAAKEVSGEKQAKSPLFDSSWNSPY